MWPFLGGIASLAGSVFKGFFGLKDKQADLVGKSMEILGDINASLSDKKAAATVLVAEAQSESWLTRTWRPLAMMTFLAILIDRWCFNHLPPGMTPGELARLYDLLELGIGGYIGTRTIEKIIDKFNVSALVGKIFK